MKRGINNRRVQHALPNRESDCRRTLTRLPIVLVCVLLTGAGTACLWAMENGVVTSATVDPARISSQSPSSAASGVARVNDRDADVDTEFWVEWGGGQPRAWFGTLHLDQGLIKAVRGYGLQADAPGSCFLENNVVTISPRVPRSFDSVLIRVVAPRSANLSVSFLANGSGTAAFETTIPLLELLKSTQHHALDDDDNKLIVRRSKSDSLRLQSVRTSMVFEPNETFEFSVLPNLVDSSEPKHPCRVQLQPARSAADLWVDERDAVRNSDGSISPAGPFQVPMPREEGVYDLIISMGQRPGPPIPQAQSDHWRKLQVVVVRSDRDDRIPEDGDGREGATTQFRVIQAFEPANFTQPLAASQAAPVLAQGDRVLAQGDRAGRPVSHGDVVSVQRLDQDLLQIGTDSWFSLPLRVMQPGHPHILEVDYPNDVPQTFGIAIYEPGSRRAVVDTGLTTSPEQYTAKPGMATYRFTFWPRTGAPVLVLSNRDAERAATTGGIRVVAGPESLRDLETHLPAGGRLFAAQLDTPHFPELFSAATKIDAASGRELRDWGTFLDGANRLIQVLKQRGYNGAVIPVVADGGSLYPSRVLEAAPCLDDGIFFATAQDPSQKDVLELLLRLFDREGLRLVPSVRFTGTLPILEAKRRLDAASSINLVDSDGRRWRPGPDSFGVGSHYNPLDPEVQAAMHGVVSELSQRCSAHASFAGVAIRLDPDSYATLPGPDWGADAATLEQFMAAHSGSRSNPPGEPQMRQAWLAWRAERLAEMYVEMSRNLRVEAPGSRLFLLGASLLDTPLVNESAEVKRAPNGLTAADALLNFGINVELLREPGIVFPEPRQLKPFSPAHVDLDRAWDHEYAKTFGQRADLVTGSLLEYPRQAFAATTYADLLPIKDIAQSTRTRLTETGALGPRGIAHGLATLDSQVILDGAWQAPRGGPAWRDIVTVYRHLPDVQFTEVSPPVGSRTQPVVIRRAVHEGKTFFYVVNDSPRPVGTKIGFDGQAALELKSLAATGLPPLERTEQGATLTLALRPYQVVGMEASLPDARIVRWETEVEQQVLATLQENLLRLKRSTAEKREYPRLTNSGFDLPAGQDMVPGWVFGKGAGMQVEVDTHLPRQGPQALHLRSETPVNWSSGPIVWLRSEWFEPAASGRHVFAGWLKTRDFEVQPHVRLLVEGRRSNNQLVRRERVLGSARDESSSTPLGADWNYYELFVEGLPSDVKEVRVGIDLRGTGDVWVDHVGVFDLCLSEQEKAGLDRDIGIAFSMLKEGRIDECEQLLKSHYAQYLFANISATDAIPATDTISVTDIISATDTTPATDPASVTEPASARIGDDAQEPPRELPEQLPAFSVKTRPDVGADPTKAGLRVAEQPRSMASASDRTLRSPQPLAARISEDRWFGVADIPHARPADGRAPHARAETADSTAPSSAPSTAPNSAPNSSPNSAPNTLPGTEPQSWLDKLKSFRIKLPEIRKRPTR